MSTNVFAKLLLNTKAAGAAAPAKDASIAPGPTPSESMKPKAAAAEPKPKPPKEQPKEKAKEDAKVAPPKLEAIAEGVDEATGACPEKYMSLYVCPKGHEKVGLPVIYPWGLSQAAATLWVGYVKARTESYDRIATVDLTVAGEYYGKSENFPNFNFSNVEALPGMTAEDRLAFGLALAVYGYEYVALHGRPTQERRSNFLKFASGIPDSAVEKLSALTPAMASLWFALHNPVTEMQNAKKKGAEVPTQPAALAVKGEAISASDGEFTEVAKKKKAKKNDKAAAESSSSLSSSGGKMTHHVSIVITKRGGSNHIRKFAGGTDIELSALMQAVVYSNGPVSIHCAVNNDAKNRVSVDNEVCKPSKKILAGWTAFMFVGADAGFKSSDAMQDGLSKIGWSMVENYKAAQAKKAKQTAPKVEGKVGDTPRRAGTTYSAAATASSASSTLREYLASLSNTASTIIGKDLAQAAGVILPDMWTEVSLPAANWLEMVSNLHAVLPQGTVPVRDETIIHLMGSGELGPYLREHGYVRAHGQVSPRNGALPSSGVPSGVDILSGSAPYFTYDEKGNDLKLNYLDKTFTVKCYDTYRASSFMLLLMFNQHFAFNTFVVPTSGGVRVNGQRQAISKPTVEAIRAFVPNYGRGFNHTAPHSLTYCYDCTKSDANYRSFCDMMLQVTSVGCDLPTVVALDCGQHLDAVAKRWWTTNGAMEGACLFVSKLSDVSSWSSCIPCLTTSGLKKLLDVDPLLLARHPAFTMWKSEKGQDPIMAVRNVAGLPSHYARIVEALTNIPAETGYFAVGNDTISISLMSLLEGKYREYVTRRLSGVGLKDLDLSLVDGLPKSLTKQFEREKEKANKAPYIYLSAIQNISRVLSVARDIIGISPDKIYDGHVYFICVVDKQPQSVKEWFKS